MAALARSDRRLSVGPASRPSRRSRRTPSKRLTKSRMPSSATIRRTCAIELGDLLFQVVFHARMAEERGWFDFDAVAAAIHDKLVRRHPHVFGDTAFGDASSAAPTGKSTRRRSARPPLHGAATTCTACWRCAEGAARTVARREARQARLARRIRLAGSAPASAPSWTKSWPSSTPRISLRTPWPRPRSRKK